MILQLLTVALILLMTAYLANQKFLSATLVLVAAVFGSVLAMGLFESLTSIVAGFRPDYARGVTFLVLFLFAFSAVRIAADIFVPKNVKMDQWADVAGGALSGLFASMIIVGTCLLGIQMLPLGTALLGYDRFPGENGMQGAEPGQVAKSQENGIWLGPDRFVSDYIWAGMSGKGLGGTQPFGAVHPDLPVELYGYRNSRTLAGLRVVPPDLFAADGAWQFASGPDVRIPHVDNSPSAGSGKHLAVIRTKVTKGTTPPATSMDAVDLYFRATASQVRVVTNNGKQVYPIGQLQVKHGRASGDPNPVEFVATPLDSGEVVADFAGDKVYTDWVFAIPGDPQEEFPRLIELKQLGRAGLDELLRSPSAKEYIPLAEKEYPPLKYLGELGSERVTVTINGQAPVPPAKIYMVRDSAKHRDAPGLDADELERRGYQIRNKEGEWGNVPNGKAGVPNPGLFQSNARMVRDDQNKGPDDEVLWTNISKYLMLQQVTPDGGTNLQKLPEYFDKTVAPMFDNSKYLIKKGETGPDGTFTIGRLQPSQYGLIITYRNEQGFYFWTRTVNVEPRKGDTQTFNDKDSDASGPFLIVDLTRGTP